MKITGVIVQSEPVTSRRVTITLCHTRDGRIRGSITSQVHDCTDISVSSQAGEIPDAHSALARVSHGAAHTGKVGDLVEIVSPVYARSVA